MTSPSSTDPWETGGVPPQHPPSASPGGGDRRPKTISVLALVLGASALFLSLIPVVGVYLGGLSGAAAVVLGIVGIVKSHRLVSSIGILLAAVGATLYFAIPDPDSEVDDDTAPAPSSAGVLIQPDVDPVVDGPFQFTIEGIEQGATWLGSSPPMKPAEKGEFVIIGIEVENVGDMPGIFYDGIQTLVDTEGNEYTTDSSFALYVDGDPLVFTGLNPGDRAEGMIVFDVPVGTVLAKMVFRHTTDSEGAEASLE